MPAAVNRASANIVTWTESKMRCAKHEITALCNAKWDIALFEKMADDIKGMFHTEAITHIV